MFSNQWGGYEAWCGGRDSYLTLNSHDQRNNLFHLVGRKKNPGIPSKLVP